MDRIPPTELGLPITLAEWQYEIDAAERARDGLGVLALALSQMERVDAAAFADRALDVFTTKAEELLQEVWTLILQPSRLRLVSNLLQIAERTRPGIEFVQLSAKARILDGLVRFADGDITGAHAAFLSVVESAGDTCYDADPEICLSAARHLRTLYVRGFPVFHHLIDLYAHTLPSALLHMTMSTVRRSLQAETPPMVVDQPGQVLAVLTVKHPVLRYVFGRATALTIVCVDDGANEARPARTLASFVGGNHTEQVQSLTANGEQALSLAKRIIGRTGDRFSIEWDIDTANECITGSSLQLALTVGIVSARMGAAVAPGILLTGSVGVNGEVRSVRELDAKVDATIWAGGGTLVVPADDVADGAIAESALANLRASGVVIQPINDVWQALAIALPTVFKPGPPRYVSGLPFGERLALAEQDIGGLRPGLYTLNNRLSLPTGPVTGLAFSADLQYLAIGGKNGTLILHNLGANRSEVHTFKHEISGVAFSPDSRFLVIAGCAGAPVLWDVVRRCEVGAKIHRLRLSFALKATSQAVAYDPAGGRVACGGTDGTIALWDWTTGTYALLPIESRKERPNPGLPSKYKIKALAFSPDSRYLACRGTGVIDGFYSVFDLASMSSLRRRILRYGHGEVSFGTDSGTLFVSDGRVVLVTRVPDFGGPMLLRHPDGVNSMDVRNDGHLLLTGCRNGSLWLWDTESLSVVSVLDPGHGEVKAVRFSPRGSSFASGAADGTTCLWW